MTSLRSLNTKVLLVHTAKGVAEAIAGDLRSKGITVDIEPDLEAALAMVARRCHHCVLLEAMPEAEDGELPFSEIIGAIRSNWGKDAFAFLLDKGEQRRGSAYHLIAGGRVADPNDNDISKLVKFTRDPGATGLNWDIEINFGGQSNYAQDKTADILPQTEDILRQLFAADFKTGAVPGKSADAKLNVFMLDESGFSGAAVLVVAIYKTAQVSPVFAVKISESEKNADEHRRTVDFNARVPLAAPQVSGSAVAVGGEFGGFRMSYIADGDQLYKAISRADCDEHLAKCERFLDQTVAILDQGLYSHGLMGSGADPWIDLAKLQTLEGIPDSFNQLAKQFSPSGGAREGWNLQAEQWIVQIAPFFSNTPPRNYLPEDLWLTMVHGDLHTRNIIVGKDFERVLILDPHSEDNCSPLTDFAKLEAHVMLDVLAINHKLAPDSVFKYLNQLYPTNAKTAFDLPLNGAVLFPKNFNVQKVTRLVKKVRALALDVAKKHGKFPNASNIEERAYSHYLLLLLHAVVRSMYWIKGDRFSARQKLLCLLMGSRIHDVLSGSTTTQITKTELPSTKQEKQE
jgi:hypothetical protein